MVKDEELRSLLRKRGYRIMELRYDGYSERKRDQLYQELRDNLAQFAHYLETESSSAKISYHWTARDFLTSFSPSDGMNLTRY